MFRVKNRNTGIETIVLDTYIDEVTGSIFFLVFGGRLSSSFPA